MPVLASWRGGWGGTAGVSEGAAGVQDQSGRDLGPRARRTRTALLDCTDRLLEKTAVRDLTVVDIAREAGTSPATFYQYFKDVTDAVLHLTERVSVEHPPLKFEEGWADSRGADAASQLAEFYLQLWETKRHVLMARDIFADEGDARFVRSRNRATQPLLRVFARRVESLQENGTMAQDVSPLATAGALVAILERLSTYRGVLGAAGVTREQVANTCAHMIRTTLALH